MCQSTFSERLRALYQVIGLLVVIAAFLVALASLPGLLRRLLDAKDRNERAFYAFELAGTWCYIYPVIMIAVFALSPDELVEVWPTFPGCS